MVVGSVLAGGPAEQGGAGQGDAGEETSILLSASPCQRRVVVMFLCVSDGSPVPCPAIHGHSFPLAGIQQPTSFCPTCVGSEHTSGGNYHSTSSLEPLGQIYPLLPALDTPFPCLGQSGDVCVHPTCCS